MTNTTDIRLGKIEEEIKKVVRRQDELQKGIDLLFAEREILEDLQGSVQHLKEIIVQNQQHQDINHNAVKSDIKDVQAGVEEAQKTLDKKELVIVAKEKVSLFNKILRKGGK